MKVALTGAGGMLGNAVQKVFSDVDLIAFDHRSLDVTSLDRVMETVRGVSPDFLIHAAAFTNVDLCESETEKAYLVNGIGARNVAMACEEIRCPIVYLSSDYVFDGSKGRPYDEWDRTNPINTYGLSKLLGEQFVSSLTSRYYIVRTSWLYGSHGKNFVDTIGKLLAEQDSIRVVNDQSGCPTFTDDLARTIRTLLGRGYGIYHVTNSGVCTWYDFARAVARMKGSAKEIVPITSEEFGRPARRPAYSVLNNTMLRLEGVAAPRDWEEALASYISGAP
jgi:dTDP-4-dehydrorhamnose reductase